MPTKVYPGISMAVTLLELGPKFGAIPNGRISPILCLKKSRLQLHFDLKRQTQHRFQSNFKN